MPTYVSTPRVTYANVSHAPTYLQRGNWAPRWESPVAGTGAGTLEPVSVCANVLKLNRNRRVFAIILGLARRLSGQGDRGPLPPSGSASFPSHSTSCCDVLHGDQAKRRTLPSPPFSASACALAASASGITRSIGILNFPFANSSARIRMFAASGWEPNASTLTAG